jgi:hypothetical protein
VVSVVPEDDVVPFVREDYPVAEVALGVHTGIW